MLETSLTDYRVRLIQTLAVLSCELALGLLDAIIGPCLMDLQQQVHTDIATAGFIVIVRAAGYILGCLLFSFLTFKMKFPLFCGCCFIFSAILTFLVSYPTTIVPLLALFGVNQFSHGAYVAGTNTFLFDVWGKGAGPALQANQVMIGLGGIISPLMASAFVSERQITGDNDVTKESVSSLFWPFAILAAFQILCSIFAFSSYFLFSSISCHPSRDPVKQKEVDKQRIDDEQEVETREGCDRESSDGRSEGRLKDTQNASTTAWKALMLLLVMMMMHMNMGILTSFSKFLTTFTVKSDLRMTPAEGARITSLFFVASTATRTISVFTVEKVGQRIWLTGSISVMLLANGFLFNFGEKNPVLLMIAVVMFGMGMSCVLGCMYGFLNNYIPISPKMSLCVFVPAFLGEFTFPVILAHWIDEDTSVLVWVVLFCSIGEAIIFAMINIICRFKLTRNK